MINSFGRTVQYGDDTVTGERCDLRRSGEAVTGAGMSSTSGTLADREHNRRSGT